MYYSVLNINRSKGERDLALYMQHKYKTGVYSAYTSNQVPRVHNMFPDILVQRPSGQSSLIVLYHGCKVHCHTQDTGCLDDDGGADEDTVNYLQMTYGQVQRRNDKQIWKYRQLKFEVLVIWQCHFDLMRREDATQEDFKQLPSTVRGMAVHVQDFFRHHYKPRPMERLTPRLAYRGGRESY